MTTGNRVVDLTEEAVAQSGRRRRAVFRLGVPILGVILVIAAILGIALYSDHANRRGALALSGDLLSTLDAQIAQRVAAYLDPCEDVLRIIHDVASAIPLADRPTAMASLAAAALKELPQIAGIFAGDDDGNFVRFHRWENGGVEIKRIVVGKDTRRVTYTEFDANGVPIGHHDDPADTYDPRTRPWFQGAMTTNGIYWTGIYIFFTGNQPGVTVTTRMVDRDGTNFVIGIDITLEQLSQFMSQLEIGVNGKAIIMDAEGRLIAAPNSELIVKSDSQEFLPPRIDDLGDAALTAAFDHFRLEGHGRWTIKRDRVSYLSSVTPLPGSERNWSILTVVPEQDFVGFVAVNNRTGLTLSLIIVVAVCILAVLLVRQGMRADALVRTMVARGELLARQSAGYATVSRQIAEGAETPSSLTEVALEFTGAARVSVWRLVAHGQILNCCDSYDLESRGHASGFELHRSELPAFFELLDAGEGFFFADATNDRRSAQFHEIFMGPLGCRALAIVPLRCGQQTMGIICLEDAKAIDGAEDFLRTLAAIYASTLSHSLSDVQSGAGAAFPPLASALQPAPLVPPAFKAHSFQSADLQASPFDVTKLRAEHFETVSAMVLLLSDPLVLARKSSTREIGLTREVTEILEESAAANGVTYLKFVGQEAIAAAGLGDGDETAMTRLAASSVAIRDRLQNLFDDNGRAIGFRIGLAYGGSFGCFLGNESSQFNLWGEAIEVAGIMAQSATPGAIQASGAAYEQLKQDFLFRPRGSFYLPGRGQAQTFVLAGQL